MISYFKSLYLLVSKVHAGQKGLETEHFKNLRHYSKAVQSGSIFMKCENAKIASLPLPDFVFRGTHEGRFRVVGGWRPGLCQGDSAQRFRPPPQCAVLRQSQHQP